MDELQAWRGMSRLAVEATVGVTSVVEEMHRTIGSGPAVLGRPLALPVNVLTRLVYGTIRGIAHTVGAGLEIVLGQLESPPLTGTGTPAPQREAVIAALNGVVGDHLAAACNPLAIPMAFRKDGERLALDMASLRARLPDAGNRLLVLVHGCAMNDLQWTRLGHDHGAALSRDVGFTPVYLHYNSGLHVSENGRAFSALLERLVAAWPVPLEEVAILGHSMGGLVARSACHAAENAGHLWRRKLRKLVCLASPHHGSPLERLGNWADVLLGICDYSAPLGRMGRLRSAGVTDLRFGNVLDEHWQGRDRFAFGRDLRRSLALPEGVECYAMAATTAPGPADSLPGDGLVPVESALGRHPKGELTLRFPEANCWIAFGMGHRDLLSRSEAYATIRAWLSEGLATPSA